MNFFQTLLTDFWEFTILEVFFQASSSFYADKWYTGIPNSKSRIIPWAIFQNWQVSWISYP